MQELLYLAHRIPYPPNKGDKVRSYHEIKHLARRYRVHLGAFVDDAKDWQYVDTLRTLCGETCFVPLDPGWARLKSVVGFFTNEALTLPYYRHAILARWVRQLLAAHPIRHAVVYSSPMAQYVCEEETLCKVADFVDVDSDKWRQYADAKPWPLSWVYRRESVKLLKFERRIASQFNATLLVAPHEAELMKRLAPECADRIGYACNGVDAEFFSPEHQLLNPYNAAERVIVFTGAMDYWPNVDAVEWFADEVLPKVTAVMPAAKFYIVGTRPAPRLARLHSAHVIVTGSVPDIRPYIGHAQVAIAPLRVARGVQNKVLEAMAMARPVIASPQAAAGIGAVSGREFLLAGDADAFAKAVLQVLANESPPGMGAAARARVLADYSWTANLSRIDELLDSPAAASLITPERESSGYLHIKKGAV
jgi:sugar transferase (PEP-CTERM/EpsH1 system associated)